MYDVETIKRLALAGGTREELQIALQSAAAEIGELTKQRDVLLDIAAFADGRGKTEIMMAVDAEVRETTKDSAAIDLRKGWLSREEVRQRDSEVFDGIASDADLQTEKNTE